MLDISIQDDFFSVKDLASISNDILKSEYSVPNSKKVEIEGWHICHLPRKCEVKDLIRPLVKKYFNYTVKEEMHDALYSMVGLADKPRPHKDKSKAQCLIYILGEEKLNNGTGFFKHIKDDQYDLNSLIGFKQNRAIFFNSNIVHSPMHWKAEKGESSWRYSICNFFD